MFEQLERYDFGELLIKRDADVGLHAMIAIHSTRLGPALGGCRFIRYDSEESAIYDVLRLARGMTYKAALADLQLGGGKSVIIRPKTDSFDRQGLFRSFGQFIDDLGGRYITAEDSGTSMQDMDTIRSMTHHVTGISPERGGGGDPSPYTALGVRRGIEAAVKFVLGRESLGGIHVAIQGVGQVGYYLCKELAQREVKLTVADVDSARTKRVEKEFGATVVSTDEISTIECDVYAPCALGGSLNSHTVPALRCKIVAGAANNQLATPEDGDALLKRDIFYAPDYAINAGGLIHVAREARGFSGTEAEEKTLRIYDTVMDIATRSKRDHIAPHRVADAMVEERLGRAAGQASWRPDR